MPALLDDIDVDSLHYYSPTQIDTFDGCKRKWVFKSLLHIVTPDGRGAALGQAVHNQLERFLKGGDINYMQPDQSGYIAAEMLPILPPRSDYPDKLIVEQKWTWHAPSSFLYTGRKDYVWLAPAIPVVGDHKTCGDFKWMKKEDALRKDIQGILYAREALANMRRGDITLKWGYIQTKKPYGPPRPVEITLLARDVVPAFLEIEERLVNPMSKLIPVHRLKKGLTARPDHIKKVLDTVPPTKSHCDAFGGCPFKAQCIDVMPDDWRKEMTQQAQISGAGEALLAGLMNKAQDNAGTAAPPAPTAGTGALLIPPPPAINIPAPPATGINPPSVVIAAPPPLQTTMTATTIPVVAPALPAPQATVPATPEATKRKRRTKAEMEAARAAEASPIVAVPVAGNVIAPVIPNVQHVDIVQAAATPDPVIDELAKIDLENVVASTGMLRVLYINAMPSKGARTDVGVATANLLARARRDTNQLLNVADYRLKPFGEGPATFAQVVTRLAASGEFGDTFIVDARTPEGSLIANPLSEIAALVVHGF